MCARLETAAVGLCPSALRRVQHLQHRHQHASTRGRSHSCVRSCVRSSTRRLRGAQGRSTLGAFEPLKRRGPPSSLPCTRIVRVVRAAVCACEHDPRSDLLFRRRVYVVQCRSRCVQPIQAAIDRLLTPTLRLLSASLLIAVAVARRVLMAVLKIHGGRGLQQNAGHESIDPAARNFLDPRGHGGQRAKTGHTGRDQRADWRAHKGPVRDKAAIINRQPVLSPELLAVQRATENPKEAHASPYADPCSLGGHSH